MRTIYLLRHAKSSWKNEELADFERPLNGRGRKSCELLGRYIKTNQLEFDLVVCSTAVRTRETIDLVRQFAKLQTEVRYDERIYEATASRLLEVVSQLENDRKHVVVVGHNPGMAELLYLLIGEEESFPTATFAKINLRVAKWSDSLENRATLEWIVRPRELEEG